MQVVEKINSVSTKYVDYGEFVYFNGLFFIFRNLEYFVMRKKVLFCPNLQKNYSICIELLLLSNMKFNMIILFKLYFNT